MAEYLTQHQELANDIAAATFRVAELVKQGRLKFELQSSVFDLILSGSVETTLKLRTLIKFGQSIKEIKDVNAEVLLKELGHLEVLAKEINVAKTDVSIEAEFKDKKYSDELGQVSKWPSPDTRRPSGRVIDNAASQGYGRQANLDQIFKFIETRPETRLKDLEQNFGFWSSRTLRRVIEQLRKSGRIERVGNPGPSSFYRAASTEAKTSTPVEFPKEPTLSDKIALEGPENRNPETIIAL